jgi:hypothetical protein
VSNNVVDCFATRLFHRHCYKITECFSVKLAPVSKEDIDWGTGLLQVQIGEVEQCGIVVEAEMEGNKDLADASCDVGSQVLDAVLHMHRDLGMISFQVFCSFDDGLVDLSFVASDQEQSLVDVLDIGENDGQFSYVGPKSQFWEQDRFVEMFGG